MIMFIIKRKGGGTVAGNGVTSTEIKEQATQDAINTAMVLLLTLPLEVLMDHYWQKSYAKRIPKFTE